MAAYATVDEFSDYLDGDPLPAHPDRLLARATDVVNELLVGAVWTTDTDGMPTDARVADKLREAVCIQADYMSRTDDELGTRALYDSVSTGGVSYSRATSGSGGALPSRYAPALLTFIRTAGFAFGVYR